MKRAFLVVLLGACASRTVPPAAPRSPEAPVALSADVVAEPAEPSRKAGDPDARVDYDINHVLSTGQSLAIGVGGRPYLTREQPFSNLMFATGVMAGRDDLTSFVPLVEGDYIPGTEASTETMSSAFANLASDEGRHPILVSVHGAGAYPYWKLRKGTRPYETGLLQVAAARDLAKKMGKTYVVRGFTNVHGESDHADKTTNYEHHLVEWQRDFERDVQELTGQKIPVPMFHTQISSWTRMMKGTPTSAIPQAQLDASVKSHGKIVLVGPKYHLSYAKDGVHLDPSGYRHMGEDYAKAYRKVVVEKGTWEPLRPVSVTREGAVITVKLVVPSPPLVIDTTLVSDPGHFGFEYTDAAASSPKIKKVELAGDDSVKITLDREPTADDKRIRYAFTGVKGQRSGPETGARGNLRDSDATPSRHGYALYNWCVHFEEAVP
jgi:hypothetical protein